MCIYLADYQTRVVLLCALCCFEFKQEWTTTRLTTTIVVIDQATNSEQLPASQLASTEGQDIDKVVNDIVNSVQYQDMYDNTPLVTGSKKKNKKRNYSQGMLPAKAKPKTTMARIVAMMAELEQRWSIMPPDSQPDQLKSFV